MCCGKSLNVLFGLAFYEIIAYLCNSYKQQNYIAYEKDY